MTDVESTETIESGVLDDISGLKSKFSITDILKKQFSNLMKDVGLRSSKKVGKSTKNRDGSVTHEMWFECDIDGKTYEVPIYINGKPTDASKRKLSLSYKYVSPEELFKGNFPESDSDWKIDENAAVVNNSIKDITTAFQNFVEGVYAKGFKETQTKFDEDTEYDYYEDAKTNEDVTSSKRIQVVLSKVKADSGYNVQMNYVKASYAPAQVLEDMNTLIENDELINSLNYDEPTPFDISVSDESFDIQDVPEVSDSYYLSCREVSYTMILDAAYTFYLDNQYLGYLASGPRMSDIQNYTSSYSWRIQEILDSVSQMVIEEGFTLENPISRIKRITPNLECITCKEITWSEFVSRILIDINSLSSTLTLYVCNLSADKQNQIQNWIRTWNHEVDYVLVRSE